jgi:hypothetical protein
MQAAISITVTTQHACRQRHLGLAGCSWTLQAHIACTPRHVHCKARCIGKAQADTACWAYSYLKKGFAASTLPTPIQLRQHHSLLTQALICARDSMARMCPTGSRLLPWLPCAPPPLLSAPLIPTASATADTLDSSDCTSDAAAGCSASAALGDGAPASNTTWHCTVQLLQWIHQMASGVIGQMPQCVEGLPRLQRK